jgi:porin
MWRTAFLSILIVSSFSVHRALAQTQTLPADASDTVANIAAEQMMPSYARAANSSFNPANDLPTKPLTGLLSATGNALEAMGVDLRMPTEEQFFDNVSEGSSPGTIASGTWIIPTLTLDLGKILGIQNGRIRFADEINMLRVNDNTGPGSFEDNADSGPLGTAKQNIKEPSSLRQLTYEQLLFDKRLDIEAGGMNLKRYFWTPDCDIDSLTCLDLMLERNAGLPPSAFSTWAGRAAFNVTPDIYIQAGAEEVNSKVNNTTGFAFGLHNSTGVFLAAEAAYKSDFLDTAYPTDFEVGGWHVTSTHPDPLNAKITRHGTSAIQLWANQTVWRQDDGATRDPNVRHLNVYIQSAKSLDNTSVYTTQLTLGSSLYAPFASRPLDIIGVQATYLQLATDERQFLQQQRIKAGGPAAFPVTSWYLEVNAHIQLYRDVALEPTVQYVVDPDTVFDAAVKTARSGWVIGATLVFDPIRLLGLGG